MRGRVRIATIVSTARWQTKLPLRHGHSSSNPVARAVATGVAAMDSQNAPTGRTMVSSTGARASRPRIMLLPALRASSFVATYIASRLTVMIRACGPQAAYSRGRPLRRRVSGPSGVERASGR